MLTLPGNVWCMTETICVNMAKAYHLVSFPTTGDMASYHLVGSRLTIAMTQENYLNLTFDYGASEYLFLRLMKNENDEH